MSEEYRLDVVEEFYKTRKIDNRGLFLLFVDFLKFLEEMDLIKKKGEKV